MLCIKHEVMKHPLKRVSYYLNLSDSLLLYSETIEKREGEEGEEGEEEEGVPK